MTEDAPGSPPNVESVDASSSSPSPSSEQELKKSWQSYISEDIPRTVVESTDSAIRSARSFQLNSSTHLRTLQDFIPQVSVQYKTYEDAFFKKIKDDEPIPSWEATADATFADALAKTDANNRCTQLEQNDSVPSPVQTRAQRQKKGATLSLNKNNKLKKTSIKEKKKKIEAAAPGKPTEAAQSISFSSSQPLYQWQVQLQDKKNREEIAVVDQSVNDELLSAREHPAVAGGIVVTAALLLMRGPRRFLFRHTLGRLQSEEAQYGRAEKNVKELSLSVDLMKKERVKLLERAAFAENEMKDGHAKLMSAGSQIQSLAKSVYKAEAKAADLMDALREIPGREALKLRAEVASMASVLRQERTGASKKIMKISELGVNV